MATTKTTDTSATTTTATKAAEPTFTKTQLKNSKKYRNYTDVLSVVLKEGTSYTATEVDKLIKDFLAREVK